MRLPFSVLLGTCLLAAPAYAAPASAIKGFTVATQFGDVAPLIKVQGVSPISPASPAPGAQSSPRNAQRARAPNNQRSGGGQRQGGGGQPQYSRGGGQHHGGGGYRGGGYRDHDRGDDGAGVAAGVLGGLLLGAIIANENQRNDCRRRPGYDPGSHTFIGPDRRRYRCP